MAKRKELRKEDVVTYADKLRYSRQQWQKEQEDPFRCFFEFPPIETEEWQCGHWWINQALLQRERRKLAKELGLLDKQK
jgi:hypothetical protein